MDIEITEKQAKKLEIYKDLLLEWNEKMNLTAITDEYEIIIKHFVDCLECTKMIKDEKNIIDVGTGAGFPGMVLAIYYDNIEFTLLDALNKRLIFLQDVVEKLNLKNVKIAHGRAEEIARKDDFKEQYYQIPTQEDLEAEGIDFTKPIRVHLRYINKPNFDTTNLKEQYDASVSRAVAQLPVLLEYTSPFVKVGGKCIVMKGDNVDDEIKLSYNALNTLKLKKYNIVCILYCCKFRSTINI